MPIDLYYMRQSPPCWSVLMAFKQLSLDVNVNYVGSESGELSTHEFQKLNPAQMAPTIVDSGLALSESRTILRYLANKYAPNSGLYPSDAKKRAIVDKMLDFDMTLWLSKKHAIVNKILDGVEPTELHLYMFEKNMQVMDSLIGDSQYVAGDELTIADLAVLANMAWLHRSANHVLNGYPHLRKWLHNKKEELSYCNEIFKN